MPNEKQQQFTHIQFVNAGAMLAMSVMTALIPFTRTNFGRRSLWGGNVLGALVFIIAYGGFAPEPLMWPYFWLWFAAVIFQRVKTELHLRREWIYSHYEGDRLIGRIGEFALCFGLGPLLLREGIQFGGFLIYCGIGIMLCKLFEMIARARTVETMLDGEIEQRYLDNYSRR
jgi:hypothetical protein